MENADMRKVFERLGEKYKEDGRPPCEVCRRMYGIEIIHTGYCPEISAG